MGMQALLIEDDETIAEPLIEGLRNYGLSVTRVATGAEGLSGPFGDVVLLDLGLPDMDGIDVCRGIRQVSDVPVIILTARGAESDKVLGLELGADDYLAKPFSLRELVARIRAVSRRTRRTETTPGALAEGGAPGAYGQRETAYGQRETEPPAAPAHGYSFPGPPGPAAAEVLLAAGDAPGTLVVDRRTRQVWVGRSQIALTPKEFELLALLCEDPGAVCSRRRILEHVWDPYYEGATKTLDVHVASLRRKLGRPGWIQTLRGVGFRLAVQAPPPEPTGRSRDHTDAFEGAFP
ncbi:response regulator transcription factor [Streptomyces viridosporus]|uniref:response regulator transcription factor n=1 Tax=Streptomyces viridosporus TaxID=67581 RepID=UPI0020966BEE|nr:response regulator transcription factor [Streptomyces viridosporus]